MPAQSENGAGEGAVLGDTSVRVHGGARVGGLRVKKGRWVARLGSLRFKGLTTQALCQRSARRAAAPLPMPSSFFLAADRGMLSLLLCVVSIALPRFIRAGTSG